MRKNRENQLPLSPSWPDHRLARELESISKILDQKSIDLRSGFTRSV